MEHFNFSNATKEDIPQLEKLVNSAYRGEGSKAGWTTEADLLDGIRTDANSLADMLEKPGSVILLCHSSKNELAGCVYLQKQGSRLYLGMLTVSPEIQGGGIGKKLLSKAESYALSVDCSAVIMTVITVRTELIEWYERRGYKNTGEKLPFPDDPRFGIPKQPLEFIVMEKTLQ